MALFVTGVGTLIHLYSIGYMHGDEKYPKFFVYLNLFAFSMLMLVLGSSMLVAFLGWEGVGACSYLLISFWFDRPTAAAAGKKAFVTNRVGDVGFMLAMSLVFVTIGSLDFTALAHAELARGHRDRHRAAAVPRRRRQVGAAAAVRVAARRHGRPDAGLRAHPRRHDGHRRRLPDGTHRTRAGAGARRDRRSSRSSASPRRFIAATIACAQNDIKKVLAYSTVSQLGYMFLADRIGRVRGGDLPHGHARVLQGAHVPRRRLGHPRHAPRAGHEEDGRAAQAHARSPPSPSSSGGSPSPACRRSPASGRRTKSSSPRIHKSPMLWAVGLLTALLTAYYMTRQVILVFFGKERFRDRRRARARAARVAVGHDGCRSWCWPSAR